MSDNRISEDLLLEAREMLVNGESSDHYNVLRDICDEVKMKDEVSHPTPVTGYTSHPCQRNTGMNHKPCRFCGSDPVDSWGYQYHKIHCPNVECVLSGVHMTPGVWNADMYVPETSLPEPCLWALRTNKTVISTIRPPEGSSGLWMPLYEIQQPQYPQPSVVDLEETIKAYEEAQKEWKRKEEFYKERLNKLMRIHSEIRKQLTQATNVVMREFE